MLVLNFFRNGVFKLVQFQMSIFLKFVAFPVSIFDFVTKKILPRFTSKLHLMQVAARRVGRAVLCLTICISTPPFIAHFLFCIKWCCNGNLHSSTLTHDSKSRTLHFDYTETSPSAFVQMPSSPSYSFKGGNANSPNSRMRLTVSLALPESEHNRKLGIFQVRVESLSANDEVIVGSSYPAMLRFKGQAIRVIESSVKMLPLVTGLKSEVQNVQIVVEEFGEGGEATMGFNVSLEKRAQVEDGGGVPQIHGASLDIESKLPLLQRMVWNWRLTIFVWFGFSSFLVGVAFLLLFCRSVLHRTNNGVKQRTE